MRSKSIFVNLRNNAIKDFEIYGGAIMQTAEKKLTGYASIDKPWLKYYSEEAVNAKIPSGNIFDCIFEKNKEHLEDTALVYFGKRISYGELFQNIDSCTKAFQALGVRTGNVVSFISVTTPELVYCVYALNKIGAVCNMLDPRSSEKTLISQIANANSRVLVILDRCMDKLDALINQLKLDHVILITVKSSMGFPIKQIYSIKTALSKESNKLVNCKYIKWEAFLENSSTEKISLPDDTANFPAFIWYTGGTTGDPKGVLLSNRNINSVAEQYRIIAKEHFRQQTWLTIANPFIAYTLICGLHLPLIQGMVCCIELYDPETLAKTIVRKKYNHVAATPIVWEKIIKNQQFQNADFSFLIAPVSGGDCMSPKLEKEIYDFFASHNCAWRICQGYGMTEVGSAVSVCFSNDCYKSGSVGVPFPHTIISAFDVDSGLELHIGEVGEVCICGPSVMLEYYKNPEATNTVIKQHIDGKKWMHTGDLGRIDEDGNLFINGRIKRMIIRFDGFKVFPSAVEEKILMHQAVEKCSVVGKKDLRSEGGQLPVAFLIIKNKGVVDCETIIEEVKALCKGTLPEYSWPVQYFIRETFPLTPAGKIDYRVLEREAQKET